MCFTESDFDFLDDPIDCGEEKLRQDAIEMQMAIDEENERYGGTGDDDDNI